MLCLNCGTEMTGNQVFTKKSQITYDTCEKCGSLWLDAGMLDKMAFQVKGSIEYCEQEKDAVPETHALKCPRCDDSALAKVKFLESGDIFLHTCRNCGGFWLDGGELNLIDQELVKIMPVSGKGFSDFVNNVHVPYWFKRVQRKSSETDFHLDVPPIKGAKMEKATTDACPSCGAQLNLYELDGMKFEGCAKCKGVWLVKDELRKLKNKVGGPSLRWLNDEIDNIEKAGVIPNGRPCVRCKDTKMLSVIFGKTSVVVDWCPKCHGEWLDRGEFQTILDYLKEEMAAAHARDIEKQVAEDARRVVEGGPESRWAEILDTKAALSALINTMIFDHSSLFDLCNTVSHTLP
jgi:Zn-finger nucleic acid-binding protein